MNGKILASTTNHLEGYKIVSYKGVFSERVVVGAGLLSDIFASFTDIVGGRSGKYEDRLEELYGHATKKLISTVLSHGGNAIVGMRLDVDEISQKNNSLFMINAYGTAVVIEKDENAVLSNESDEHNDNFVQGLKVERKIKALDFLESVNKGSTPGSITSELNKDPLLELDIHAVREILNTIEYRFSGSNDDLMEILSERIPVLEMDDLKVSVYERLENFEDLKEAEFDFYKYIIEPKYDIIDQLLKPNAFNSFNQFKKAIFKIYLPTLQKNKSYYDSKDIEYLKTIIEELENFKTTLRVKQIETTGTFNIIKKVWICATCHYENKEKNTTCEKCSSTHTGFTENEEIYIKKTIKYLKKLIRALEESL